MNLINRIERLEQIHRPFDLPKVRIFACNGSAEDAGPTLVSSPRPRNTPPGFVWAMRICGCAADGFGRCRYPAEPGDSFTIDFARGEADE